MAAQGQEQVDIFETIAKGTVTLKELREALSQAKKDLDKLNVGEADYQAKLKDVITLQNLMKGAVNGTTANIEDLRKAANGTAVTYNGLVNQMANAKRELRNLDLATQAGRDRFEELSREIENTNKTLKKLDEKQGSFVRNVGNYKSAFEGLVPGLKGVNDSLGLIGKQPVLGIITLLAPVISQIAGSLKDNKKALDALKPVLDFFSGLLDTITKIVTDLVEKLSEFVSSNGLFKKIIEGVMGVGNAILQFILTPIKAVAAAFKVFQEEGVKGIGNAAKAMWAEVKSGVAFKTNFQAGQKFADTIIDGAKSRKKEAQKAGKDLADEAIKAMEKRVKEYAEKQKYLAEARKYLKQFRDELDKDAEKETEAILKQTDDEFAHYMQQLEDEAEAERFLREAMAEEAEKEAQRKVEALNSVATATSSILNTIADAYENNTELTEQEAKRVKNLRIAAATIDMIQGAVTAFSTAQSLGPIAGPIVGAINAAAVVATGLANIAKIKSANISKDSATTAATSVTTQAPAIQTAVPQTAMVTGARTETALNRAAQPQKVYILQSDIEAAGNASQVQVAESSF